MSSDDGGKRMQQFPPTDGTPHTVGHADEQVTVVRSTDSKFPDQSTFDRVEILPNGWLRCIVPAERSGSPDSQTEVDYLPPDSVVVIWATESDRHGR